MGLHFHKMHGLGNDYVYIVCDPQDIPNPAGLARKVSPRHFAVGSDGLILIHPPSDPSRADFRMRMFNADGSEAQMCGNGIRCLGKLVYDHGHTTKTRLTIETASGPRYLDLLPDTDGRVQQVRVQMGEPILPRGRIPLAGGAPDQPAIAEVFPIGPHQVTLTAVSMGNPHAVIQVDDIDQAPVTTLGPLVEQNPLFPERVNVEFCQLVSPTEIRLRVWERGSGETQACGTGACATLVACVLEGRSERRARIHLKGGELQLEWSEAGPVLMTGPAVEVYRGELQEAWLESG